MQAPIIFFTVLIGIYLVQSAIEDSSKCEKDAACFSNDECNGGSCQPPLGVLPVWLGTCDCSACYPTRQAKPCKSDADCGGLKTACNNKTNLCDCVGTGLRLAKQSNTTLGKVLTDFCNKQKCDNTTNTDICNGLPCRSGKCNCAASPK
uniref:Uncharacterized protein n=1 Tax=Acrobeloides nanus TaxID=290746 RepID=A0A914CYD8_9BILA